LDKFDYRILNELLKDARMSFSAIARKLGISPHTVATRYTKMKNDGMINGSVISLELSKIGYQGKAFLMITNSPNQEKSKTIEALTKIRNIISITEIIGFFDILAIAPITDLDSAIALVKEVKALSGVHRVEITLANETAFPVSSDLDKTIAKKYVSPAI
jgi:Lrp/AsnC family transcriptional regulator, regulator for asnA, asnC and gidA